MCVNKHVNIKLLPVVVKNIFFYHKAWIVSDDKFREKDIYKKGLREIAAFVIFIHWPKITVNILISHNQNNTKC